MSEKWVKLSLGNGEILICDKCEVPFSHQITHLCADPVWDINEVVCEKCWKIMQAIKELSGEHDQEADKE